jgi:mannose-6-phosphate isomerase-like protein (cupin superfamily)
MAPIPLARLVTDHDRRLVYAVFVFLAGGLSITIITAIAVWSGRPLVVPSLGPAVFLVFNRSQTEAARPRNIVLGHAVGVTVGYLSLVVFGLAHAPSVIDGGLTATRIGAAALSIALTSAVMIVLRVEHGPAGATTLIVSLGFVTTPLSMGLLMAGVCGLAAIGVAIDRLVGLQLPLWSGEHRHNGGDPTAANILPLGPATAPRAPSARGGADGRSRSWLVATGEGRRVDLAGCDCVVKVEDAIAAGTYSLVEVGLPPGPPSTLMHAHYEFDESYFILEGDVLAEVGGERSRVHPGAVITVPAGVPHTVAAAGRRPARCLCITRRANRSDLEFLP